VCFESREKQVKRGGGTKGHRQCLPDSRCRVRKRTTANSRGDVWDIKQVLMERSQVPSWGIPI
jgi:hypothetical protein